MLDVLKPFLPKNFVGAITGGLNFDSNRPFSVTTFHLYIWFFLVIIPVILIHTFGTQSLIVEIAYPCIILLLFTILKLPNYFFHKFFDVNERGKVRKSASRNKGNASNGNKDDDDDDDDDEGNVSIAKKNNGPTNYMSTATVQGNESHGNNNAERSSNNHKISVGSSTSQGNLEIDDELLLESQQTNGKAARDSLEIIPQIDGGSDDPETQTPNSQAKVYTLSYVDPETGEEFFYDMKMTEEEYKSHIGKESSKKDSSTTSQDLNSRATPSIQIVAENRRSNQRNTSTSSTVGNSSTNASQSPTAEAKKVANDTSELIGKEDESHFYKLKLPLTSIVINIRFDRLLLEHIMDRNFSILEMLFSIILAALVGSVAYRMVYHEIFSGFIQIVFLFVAVASSQFSLLKSPQPDANSPVHYNRLTAYTRSFYLLFFAVIAVSTNFIPFLLQDTRSFKFYGIWFNVSKILVATRDISIHIILLFPFIFSVAWLPQSKTFIIYILEYFHIHLLGGTGFINLSGAIVQVILDIFAVVSLVGIGYYSALNNTFGRDYYSAVYSCALVALSYLLSRAPSNPLLYWNAIRDVIYAIFCNPLIKNTIGKRIQSRSSKPVDDDEVDEETRKCIEVIEKNLVDVNPTKRIVGDFVLAVLLMIPIALIQVFDVLRLINPYFTYAVSPMIVVIGFSIHYLLPQLKYRHPFSLFKSALFDKSKAPKKRTIFKKQFIMWAWFEYMYYILRWIEMILYILLIMSSVSTAIDNLLVKGIHPLLTLIITSVLSIKLLRNVFSEPSRMYIALFFTLLFFNIDFVPYSETLILDFSLIYFLTVKFEELKLKYDFVFIYTIPVLSWGAISHIFMNPAGIPYTALLIAEFLVSVLIGSPMYPFFGGALWFMSYPRTIKFWERDYKTSRKDTQNMTLSQSLGFSQSNQEYDDNNLNSIFYEHLVISLRSKFPEAIRKGEFGNITTGDIFIIANDDLFAMVHIVEVGNGFLTFQLRGVEFKGTLCQEQEQSHVLECMNEPRDTLLNGCREMIAPEGRSRDDDSPNYLAKLLSAVDVVLSPHSIISLRYHTFQIINTKITLNTYSVSKTNIDSYIGSYDLRSSLIRHYVKCCIYYLTVREEMDYWVSYDSPFGEILDVLKEAGNTPKELGFDADPVFSQRYDCDFDFRANGVTYDSYLHQYKTFINYCITEREKKKNVTLGREQKERIQKLSYMISLVARRALASSAGIQSADNLAEMQEKWLQLFKGDYRITSAKDEWVFGDMQILQKVIAKALRLSLKVFQDIVGIFGGEEPHDNETYFNELLIDNQNVVIAHETDPQWRIGILNQTENLFSIRKSLSSSRSKISTALYEFIRLEMQSRSFGILKLNRETVRGLWAGQQNELSFLGHEAAERGSIQQMKQMLRNIINSSCDIPIGYPAYVSPLTTAYW